MSLSRKPNSILSSLLFGTASAHPQGRVIKFDEHVPEIKLSTGTIKERIMTALEEATRPLTAKEIADRIGTTQPRAAGNIRQMVTRGTLLELKLDGCVTEYMLTDDSSLI